LSDASAQIVKQVEVWHEKFAGITDAKTLNDQMPLVKAIESPVVQPQVAKLLMDRGAALKFEFDGKAKAFREPVAA
jgi:hypothetical protein